MSTDIDDAANTVIGLTNTVGAAAADLQNTTAALRTARRAAPAIARHPRGLAALGAGLIAVAAVLESRGRRRRPPAPPV